MRAARYIIVLVALLLLAVMGACSRDAAAPEDSAAKTQGTPMAEAPPAVGAEEKAAGADEGEAAPAPAAPAERAAAPGAFGAGGVGEGGGGKSGGRVGPADKAPAGKAEARADLGRGEGDGDRIAPKEEEEPPVRRPQGEPQSGQLTAGEWRDLDNWGFWQGLMENGQDQQQGAWARMSAHWGFQTRGRVPVEIKSNGAPVADARVQLIDSNQQVVWEGRSDRKGRADLFAGMFMPAAGPFTVVATSGNARAELQKVQADASQTLSLELKDPAWASNALDLMFVVDTTGSMGDELAYLQAELRTVVERVQEKHGQQLKIRTSVNFYRDTYDEYTVRPFPFTTDLRETVNNLAGQRAGGGGDFPEAVDEAMVDAVNKHDWSQSAKARLLFLVLDAPPHYTPEALGRLRDMTAAAARQGIRVIPLVGSGIDKETEFLMRFMAVSTGGTYVFLTDHSGIGGSHIKPTIGPHKIEHLDQLLVRVINDYMG